MIFYEKPGCVGNSKQKAILDSLNIKYETKSILDTPWSKEELEEYFDGLEVVDCINPFAPQVKSGEVSIDKLTKKDAIDLMLEERILIKRPLINVDGRKICGFNTKKLSEILGIEVVEKKPFVCKSTRDNCTPKNTFKL